MFARLFFNSLFTSLQTVVEHMYKNIFSIKKINNAIKTEILNATVKTSRGEKG